MFGSCQNFSGRCWNPSGRCQKASMATAKVPLPVTKRYLDAAKSSLDAAKSSLAAAKCPLAELPKKSGRWQSGCRSFPIYAWDVCINILLHYIFLLLPSVVAIDWLDFGSVDSLMHSPPEIQVIFNSHKGTTKLQGNIQQTIQGV